MWKECGDDEPCEGMIGPENGRDVCGNVVSCDVSSSDAGHARSIFAPLANQPIDGCGIRAFAETLQRPWSVNLLGRF